MKRREFYLLKVLPSVIGWLNITLKVDVKTIQYFNHLISEQRRILKTRGVTGLITYNKAVRLSFLKFLEGNPLQSSNIKLTKSGIPKVLKDLIPIVQDINHPYHYKVIRLINTVLFSTRSLKTKPKPDLKTISDPFNGIDVKFLEVYGKRF